MSGRKLRRAALGVCFIVIAAPLWAVGSENDADPASNGATEENLDFAAVRYVVARESSDGTWQFEVTVEHNDEGWDHYADAWSVVHPDTNQIIAERILLHPHDTEQPFTRSQNGIVIPDGLDTVIVRARCTVHGSGMVGVEVDLNAPAGDLFEINRL